MPGSPATSPNLGIPRYADADTASFSSQVNSVTDVIDAAAHLHAAGDLIVSAASTRAGCLLCDGSAVSRATYSALFTAIGTSYGAGDGSSTFNVPDFRGRAILGAGTGAGLTARSLGQTGGEETHLLATGEMPAHNHTDGGHAHSLGVDVPYSTTSIANKDVAGGSEGNVPYAPSGAWGQVTATSTGYAVIQNAGGGGSHNNMQPFGVANVFVFTGATS